MTASRDVWINRLNTLPRASICLAIAGLAFLGQPASASAKCVAPTDPIAGTLRKVTIRDVETRKLITNWHVVASEPICVKVGDVLWENQIDIQVEFAKSVDLKKVDAELGMPFGVKGKIVGYRDPRDTGDIIVTEAKPYGDLDDAGEIRR